MSSSAALCPDTLKHCRTRRVRGGDVVGRNPQQRRKILCPLTRTACLLEVNNHHKNIRSSSPSQPSAPAILRARNPRSCRLSSSFHPLLPLLTQRMSYTYSSHPSPPSSSASSSVSLLPAYPASRKPLPTIPPSLPRPRQTLPTPPPRTEELERRSSVLKGKGREGTKYVLEDRVEEGVPRYEPQDREPDEREGVEKGVRAEEKGRREVDSVRERVMGETEEEVRRDEKREQARRTREDAERVDEDLEAEMARNGLGRATTPPPLMSPIEDGGARGEPWPLQDAKGTDLRLGYVPSRGVGYSAARREFYPLQDDRKGSTSRAEDLPSHGSSDRFEARELYPLHDVKEAVDARPRYSPSQRDGYPLEATKASTHRPGYVPSRSSHASSSAATLFDTPAVDAVSAYSPLTPIPPPSEFVPPPPSQQRYHALPPPSYPVPPPAPSSPLPSNLPAPPPSRPAYRSHHASYAPTYSPSYHPPPLQFDHHTPLQFDHQASTVPRARHTSTIPSFPSSRGMSYVGSSAGFYAGGVALAVRPLSLGLLSSS